MISGNWELPYQTNKKIWLFLDVIRAAYEPSKALPNDVLKIIALVYTQLQQTSLKKIFDELTSKKPIAYKPNPYSLLYKPGVNQEDEIQKHIRALFTQYDVYAYVEDINGRKFQSSKRNDIDSDGYVNSKEDGFIIARFPYEKDSYKCNQVIFAFHQVFNTFDPKNKDKTDKFCMYYAENNLYIGFAKDELAKIISRGKRLQEEREEESYHEKFELQQCRRSYLL